MSQLSSFITPSATPDLHPFPYTTLFRSRTPAPIRSAIKQHPMHFGLLFFGGWGVGGMLNKLPNTRSVRDRKRTRLNSSHSQTSYAVFCFKKKPDRTNDHTHKSEHNKTSS